MRPLEVRMVGFGAFRDETIVSFDDVDLAVFVGNTGAGKSTIIDAITFALFGSIARYDDGRLVAPIINALENEAKVQLDFELGGERYTAVRVVRRTKTGATTKEARLESSGEVLADSAKTLTAEVEQLLGLDLDRFHRVVVLPQGKFAAFLQDKASSRQELLRQLLDLGVYEEVGKQARSIAATAQGQAESLETALGQVAVSDEKVAELEADADALGALSAKVAAEVAAFDEASTAVDECTQAHEDLGVLQLAMAEVGVPEEVEKLGENLIEAQHDHEQSRAELATTDETLNAARTAVEEGPNPADCEAVKKARASLATIEAELSELNPRMKEVKAEETLAAAAVEKLDAEIEEANGELDRAVAAVAEANAAVEKAPDESELAMVEQRHTELKVKKDQRAEFEKAQSEAKRQASDLAKRETEAAAMVDECDQAQRQVERDNTAASLAALLETGEPCPICLRPVDDLPEHHVSADLDAAAKALREAKAALKQRTKELARAEKAATQATAELTAHDKQVDELEAAIADGLSLAEVKVAAEQREKLVADRDAAIGHEAKVRAKLKELQSGKDAKLKRQTLSECEARLAKTDAEISARQESAATLADELDGAPSGDEVESLLKQTADLAQKVRTLETQRQEAQKAVAGAEKQLEGAKRREIEFRRSFDSHRDKLTPLNPPAPQQVSLLDDWRELASWSDEQSESLAAELAKANKQVSAAKKGLAAAEKRLVKLAGGIEDAPAEPSDFERRVATLKAASDERVREARQQQAKLASQRTEVDRLRVDAEVHDQLGALLRTDGFERWLLDETVDVLIGNATERLFELSGQQYSLEAEGMDFRVRDHRNGDEVRDAKTLSGGETFLASLALALGLADSLEEMAPEGAPPVESLFLDEGFGTLDPEHLDVVAAAIEELGASGRMVGIVTHIRELAERVPLRFEVTKGTRSSTIERVDA